MTEKNSRPPEGAPGTENLRNEEIEEKDMDTIIDESFIVPPDYLKGNDEKSEYNLKIPEGTDEFNIDGFSDINDKYNKFAWGKDESKQIRAKRWLEAVWDEKRGLYTQARYKGGRKAYDKYTGDIRARGREIYHEAISQINKRGSVHELPVKEKTETMTLEKFEATLTDYISSDSLSRSEIMGWNLRQLKQGKNTEPKFRLAVMYENEQAKNGKKEKVYVGTYEEIIEKFERDLELLDSNLKVVDL